MTVSANDLIYFVEVTNTLNLSRASERIGISQPSLSTAIKRLEHAIGTKLFNRSKGGVTLTQAGKNLLSHAKQLLQLWDTVKSTSLASHYEVQGSVSLGCHSSIALYSLPQFLPNLLSDYPKLEIQLKHDISRKILERVINLSIDIGIVVNPHNHPDLIIHKLYDDKVTLWNTTETKKTHQNIYSGNPVIICDPELVQTQWLLNKLHKKKINFNRIISSSNYELIASLTAHGGGIGILPTTIAQSTYPSKLKAISEMPVYPDSICLIYRHENRDIKAVQTIINAIKMYYKSKINS